MNAYRALLAVLSRVSNSILLLAVAAPTDAVTATTANLSVIARRDAGDVCFLAVASLAAPSRQAIARAAFALTTSTANLKAHGAMKQHRNIPTKNEYERIKKDKKIK